MPYRTARIRATSRRWLIPESSRSCNCSGASPLASVKRPGLFREFPEEPLAPADHLGREGADAVPEVTALTRMRRPPRQVRSDRRSVLIDSQSRFKIVRLGVWSTLLHLVAFLAASINSMGANGPRRPPAPRQRPNPDPKVGGRPIAQKLPGITGVTRILAGVRRAVQAVPEGIRSCNCAPFLPSAHLIRIF